MELLGIVVTISVKETPALVKKIKIAINTVLNFVVMEDVNLSNAHAIP